MTQQIEITNNYNDLLYVNGPVLLAYNVYGGLPPGTWGCIELLPKAVKTEYYYAQSKASDAYIGIWHNQVPQETIPKPFKCIVLWNANKPLESLGNVLMWVEDKFGPEIGLAKFNDWSSTNQISLVMDAMKRAKIKKPILIGYEGVKEEMDTQVIQIDPSSLVEEMVWE